MTFQVVIETMAVRDLNHLGQIEKIVSQHYWAVTLPVPRVAARVLATGSRGSRIMVRVGRQRFAIDMSCAATGLRAETEPATKRQRPMATNTLMRRFVSYARKTPNEESGLNPGNTELRSVRPRWPRTSSLSTVRKSVVTARSRVSNNCSFSRPGHVP